MLTPIEALDPPDLIASALSYRRTIAPPTRQIVFPLVAVGSFVIPALWICTPHRPWMRTAVARWAVFAACTAFEVFILARQYTSPNEVLGYGQGLVAIWSVMNVFRFVVVNEPQMTAARIVKVTKESKRVVDEPAVGPTSGVDHGQLRRRRGKTDEAVQATNVQPEYVWQPFPAKEPFMLRLQWTLDLLLNLRGIGILPFVSPCF